jgi:hypothetical protein
MHEVGYDDEIETSSQRRSAWVWLLIITLPNTEYKDGWGDANSGSLSDDGTYGANNCQE